MRGPRIRNVRITALDALAEPVTMTVEIGLHAIRYVENRDTTAVVAGSRSAETSFTERWTLGLSDDPQYPWRVVGRGGVKRSRRGGARAAG